jgi:hypothetical protein
MDISSRYWARDEIRWTRVYFFKWVSSMYALSCAVELISDPFIHNEIQVPKRPIFDDGFEKEKSV